MLTIQSIFTAWYIIILVLLVVYYFKGVSAVKIFPDVLTVNIIYHAKYCSGYSKKSWRPILGRANNILEIIITDTELWIKLPALFAGIGKSFDLLHRIELKNVLSVQHSKKDWIVVSFKDQNEVHKQIFLRVYDPNEFIRIIQMKSQLSTSQ